MALSARSGIPDEFRAGDSVSFTEAISTYSATDSWRARIYWTSPGQDERIVTASTTTTGLTYAFALTPTESAEFDAPGYWWWCFVVENDDGERVTVSDGTCHVLENLTAGTIVPTFARRMVKALEARIEGRVEDDSENISYLGVQVSQIPIAQCVTLLSQYRSELAGEMERDRKRRGQPSRGFTSRINLRG
jgi:hypothetical protein